MFHLKSFITSPRPGIRILPAVMLLNLITLLPGVTAYAAPGDLLFPLPHPTGAASSFFGRTVAETPQGNILAGTPGSSIGSLPGSVFVFNRTTGQQMLQIPNPQPGPGDQFGAYVWSTASRIVAGAPFSDDNGSDNGGAYVFDAISGALVHTLANPVTTSTASLFGWSVNAIGEDVLVGARDDDAVANNAGAAFLFSGSTGQLIHSFYAPVPGVADAFGMAVTGVGTKVVIGAPARDSGAVADVGMVYVFDSVTGNHLLTIPNPDPADSSLFGIIIRAYGNDILVGSNGTGAYLFNGSTGALIREFNNPEPGPLTGFGGAVGSNGPDVFVGAKDLAMPSGSEGAVFVFNAATGAYKRKLISPQVVTGPTAQRFGVSVYGLGDNVLVSAHFESTGSNVNTGNVYLFDSSNPTAADPLWINLE